MVGNRIKPDFPMPDALLKNITFHVDAEDKKYLTLNRFHESKFSPGTPEALPVANTPGTFQMKVKLFGLIPVKDMIVNVLPRVKIIPGGQSIGVLLHTQGVMVVGLADIKTTTGEKVNPASQAGISVGDVILSVNGIKIKNDTQLRDVVSSRGQEGKMLHLQVKRGEQIFSTGLRPIYCPETKRYRIGLFIRDSAAGVGTLTFYHPGTGYYGALGHMIADIDTAQQIDLENGSVIGADIQSISPGKKGRPGEKIGLFDGKSNLSGNILKNTKYGIFGKLEQPITNPIYNRPIPVALAGEITEGPASILTVVKGNKIEKYDIEIQKVLPKSQSDGKGLVIEITDNNLLQRSGGIIQGMSGSPIIQNGKLVGAVTHVFINDPGRGYGVLAQWMLQEAEILPQPVKRVS